MILKRSIEPALLMRVWQELLPRTCFRQIDQHYVGVPAKAIEHDAGAVRCNVKGPHLRWILKAGKLSGLHRLQVQKPEVLPGERALHVDETLAAGQEPVSFSGGSHRDLREIDWLTVGVDGQEPSRPTDSASAVSDQ